MWSSWHGRKALDPSHDWGQAESTRSKGSAVKATLVISGIIIGALGVAFVVGILRSDLGAAMKAVGVVMVAAMMAIGAIRIWLASRPYGNPKIPPKPTE